ncbi:MAG: SMC-Scp complex subunit ScpB [Oscillospiraceae bacterium]
MEINCIKGAIEAMLFSSGEPIETERIAQALALNTDVCYKIIKDMQVKYSTDESGIEIVELNDTFQLCSKAVHAPYIKQILELKRNIPLSNAAMEILAIIAYNQPVTKSFIEQIRGVDSSQTVNSLVEKGLIDEAGRLDVPGRPISYKTTLGFLRTFGLKNISQLPPLPDDGGQVTFNEIVQNAENPENVDD